MRYEFHPRLFNPLYWHVRKYLSDPKIRFIFIYGGSSAAKTYTLAQAFALDQIEHGYNMAVFRKESTTIDDTVYSDFKEVSQRLKLSPLHNFIEKEMRVKSSGAYIKFKGIDDPEKIKGLSAYQHVFLNELSKFDFSDFKEAKRRLRGRPNQKIIADWNPIVEDHWIKKEVLDKEEWIDQPLHCKASPTKFNALSENSSIKINKTGNTVLICTTYLDNYWVVGHPSGKGGFVDNATLDEFEWLKKNDEHDYMIYALGKWGRVQTGKEFFDNFSRAIHVKPEAVGNDDDAYILSFDFNNLPYSTCLVIQTSRPGGVMKIKVVDEICLPPPTNTIEDVREEFEYRFKGAKSIFYCIDPAGRAEGQRKSRAEAFSFDDMIQKEFMRWLSNRSDITPSRHPPRAKRRMAMKELLSGTKGVQIEINPKCKNLINDFERLLIETDGGYMKEKERDKETGQTWEKLGHCMDAFVYVLASMFNNKFY